MLEELSVFRYTVILYKIHQLLFSMRGGTGINIEPQEMYRQRYDSLRKRDINLFVGIGSERGELELHGSGDTASMIGKVNGFSTVKKVPIITLSDVFRDYVPEGKIVQFLKIDVEGFEAAVVQGMDFSLNKPLVVSIENLAGENYDEYESILIDNGYAFAHFDGQNRYYVLRTKKDILENFKDMDKLDDFYEIISVEDATKYLSYEQSTSWKITAPLRKVAVLLDKLRKHHN